MGTHLQIIPTTMQQMWLAFLLTRTNFLVGALDLIFFILSASAWVLVPCASASASSLLISSSIYCVVLEITINGEISLSAISYIATGPPGLIFLPFLQLPAWQKIPLYQFRCHLYWTNTSYLPIIPGGCQHIPWTFEFSPNFWDASFCVDLGIYYQCWQCPIPVKLPVLRLCNRGDSGLLLDLL